MDSFIKDQWNILEQQAYIHKKKVLISSNPSQSRVQACGIDLNYAYQYLDEAILQSLFKLAHCCDLSHKIHGLMTGACVNLSEGRPALHTALRLESRKNVEIDNQKILDEIFNTRAQMLEISERIRTHQWLGFSGKPIKNIVNIGIGGSDLGPRFCLDVFSDLICEDLNFYFISDADPDAFKKCVSKLTPETTLFIVASKSFTTQETLFNARKAKAWIGDENRFSKHFIAVTANLEQARCFGIETILPIWDWVGGRYSFCSAINLITTIAIGYENFSQILAGAHDMDVHFKDTEFSKNLPVLLALFGIWNNNFLNIHNLITLTYSQRLNEFVPYIQQLDMESNGKSINNKNQTVTYATGPLLWGGPGNQAQHSYYQLLCQGTHQTALDLVTVNLFDGEMINDMCMDKIRVLTQGVANPLHAHGYIKGQVPLNHIRLADHSPYTIGALVALYEHKIYAQSVIWDINAFDQPGVESAKQGRTISSVVEYG